MNRWHYSAIGLMLSPLFALADVPGQINHQGLVKVNGTPYNGMGQFRFAIVDPSTGFNLWTNDNLTIPGPGEPQTDVSILVTDGIYSIMLGDTSVTGMTNAIPTSVFRENNVALRVWFNDGMNGRQRFDDQPLRSVPYAKSIGILAHGHSGYISPEVSITIGSDINNEAHWFPIPSSTKSVKLNKGQTIINYAVASFFGFLNGVGDISFRPYVRPVSGPDINGERMTVFMPQFNSAQANEEDEAMAGTVIVNITEEGTYTIGLEAFAATNGIQSNAKDVEDGSMDRAVVAGIRSLIAMRNTNSAQLAQQEGRNR